MKKLLIICNYFAPDNEIAAVRITKFSKYLKEKGYKIIVITEEKHKTLEDEVLKADADGIEVIYAHNSQWVIKAVQLYEKVIKKAKSKRYQNLDDRYRLNTQTGNYEFYPFETAHPVIGSLDYLVELARQYNLFGSVKGFLNSQKDIASCFSSYGGYFSIFAGDYYKKNNVGVQWIFDIRDSVCRQKLTPSYVRSLAMKLEKKACQHADVITTVTKVMCRNYERKYGKKVFCITNGYDRSDREGIVPKRVSMDKLIFTYTGAMYGGLQDLSVFFSCIKDLAGQGKILLNKIEIHFAGRQSAYEVFERQAKKHGIHPYCVYYGRLPRLDSLRLQMESDILLVSAWDFKADYSGILTGKVLEYMSADRPVIAVVNGDVERNELANVIRRCGLGMVYEQSNHARDYILLQEYIYNRYLEFENNIRLTFTPVEKKIAQYDYRILTDKLMEIIERP